MRTRDRLGALAQTNDNLLGPLEVVRHGVVVVGRDGLVVNLNSAAEEISSSASSPFISGKDSLNNEFSYVDKDGVKQTVVIPSSLLICLGLTVIGYRVSTGLADGGDGANHHVIGVSLSMLLMGLFMMVTRRKAVTQILALLTVENAVFLVALGATSGMPLIVELGISFDVILAVLVLGILVHRIAERFESMDVSRLSKLKG